MTGKKDLEGRWKLISGSDLEDFDIRSASRITWNGLPPGYGKGIFEMTELIKCSMGQLEGDNDIEYN
jgi:hypothetical protein